MTDAAPRGRARTPAMPVLVDRLWRLNVRLLDPELMRLAQVEARLRLA